MKPDASVAKRLWIQIKADTQRFDAARDAGARAGSLGSRSAQICFDKSFEEWGTLSVRHIS